MSSQSLASFAVPGGAYGYTGAPVDTLQSFENTLATGLVDESTSTRPFADAMTKCVKEIVKSLRRSPRADNLIYRHVHFATGLREVHGFKPLAQINEGDYDNCVRSGGQTILYDASDSIIGATLDYGQKQAAQKFLCNGVCYMITDGCDYGSTLGRKDVKMRLAKAVADESLESLVTILIGVNDDPGIQADLKSYKEEVGFTQYIPVEKADEATLAKLADFISRSVSAQSQALGSGGPSQSLTF